MTLASMYMAWKKYDLRSEAIKRSCWKILSENHKRGKRDKNRVQTVIDILCKYQVYHTMRRWKRQVTLESQVKDKNKIEGAYLLLRRFKNRLKAFDETVRVIHDKKADLSDFELLKASI